MSTLSTITDIAPGGRLGPHGSRDASPETDTVAVLYENREWMDSLFAAMDARGVRYEGIDLADSAYRLGRHDDYPMACGIAWQMLPQARRSGRKAPMQTRQLVTTAGDRYPSDGRGKW